MPELLKACAGCGCAMNPTKVLYDTDARPVCPTCFDRADLLATDRRAADNIRKAGYACIAGGAVALVAPIGYLGFQIVCAVLVVTSGLFVLQSLARGNERFTRHLTLAQRRLAWACTLGGGALTALSFMGANFARVLFS